MGNTDTSYNGIGWGNIVPSRFSEMSAFANGAYSATTGAIQAVNQLVASLSVPEVSSIAAGTVEVAAIDYTTRPSLGTVEIPTDWPVNETAPLSLIALPTLTPVSLPVLSFTAPSYAAPTKPSLSVIPEPEDAPSINDVTVPTLKAMDLPKAPTLADIIIPGMPEISIAPFDYEAPTFSLDDPAKIVWGGNPVYVSDMWSELLGKVLGNIKNGGTGLVATVETELYKRHLDRTQEENARLYAEANNYFAARGFSLPPGALAGRLNEINQQISRNNLAASRDITISQADLAQKNTQFMVEMGAKLEGMIREFYTSNTNRTLEASKLVAQNAIEVYDAMARGITIKAEIFKANAMAYDSRVKAALTAVEAFKGQIEGAKVSAEVQKTLVDIYTTQVGAVETMMKLYVAEMEGAKIASDIEQAKLALYESKVKTFIARLDGEKTKAGLYESQLKAEGIKAETYKTQVDAYGVEVDAAIKQYDAQLQYLDAISKGNAAEIERYRANLSGYETTVRAKAAEIASIVEGFKAEAMAYEAETGAEAAHLNAQVEEIKARIAEADFNMRKAVAEIEAVTKGYVSINELKLKGEEGIMNIGAQLTASAMNAVHASASYGYSSNSSESTSKSESVSENHNYDETSG